MGPMPDHQWSGTSLRFQEPDGDWGKYVDLRGPQGYAGAAGGGGGGGSGTGMTPTERLQLNTLLAIFGGWIATAPTVSMDLDIAELTVDGTGTATGFYTTIVPPGTLLDATYEWDWGDGATSTTLNASHTYADSGTYTVSFRARNHIGWSEPATEEITVSGETPVNIAFTPLGGISTDAPGDTLTIPESTTPASDFIALVAFLQAEGVTEVTDNKGNTYTKIWESPNDPGTTVAMWACVGAVGGAGHTFTAHGAVQYGSVFAGYCTGYDAADPFATIPLVQGTAAGNELSLNQPTLPQAHCLLLYPVLINGNADNPGMNDPAGFSSWFKQTNWFYWTGMGSYLVTTSDAAATRTVTGSNWNGTAGGIICIKEG